MMHCSDEGVLDVVLRKLPSRKCAMQVSNPSVFLPGLKIEVFTNGGKICRGEVVINAVDELGMRLFGQFPAGTKRGDLLRIKAKETN